MLKLTRKVRWELAGFVDAEVRATLGGERNPPAAQNRIEALGMTLSHALPAAAESWRPIMDKLGVRARLVGAFSFGAPQVRFVDSRGASRTSALADFMMVIDDLRAAHASRNALLVRTRMAADSIGDGEDCSQAPSDLYAAWPPFHLRGPDYSDAPRNLRADTASDRASGHGCLAAIDLRASSLGWTCRPSGCSPSLHPASLGTLLVSLATGALGRPACRDGLDDWSVTVDELLRRTVRATLTGMSAPTPELRSTTTFAGQSGTGHVVFENRTGLSYEEAITVSGRDAPLSVAHVCID